MTTEALQELATNPIAVLCAVVGVFSFIAFIAASFAQDDEACRPEQHCGNCAHLDGFTTSNRCGECLKAHPFAPKWKRAEGE